MFFRFLWLEKMVVQEAFGITCVGCPTFPTSQEVAPPGFAVVELCLPQ